MPSLSSLSEPRLQPFLPMLYVAWADGELSDEEIGELRSLAAGLDCIDGDCRQALEDWLDSSAPPSADDLSRLLERMRRLAPELDPGARESLVELGVELARAGGAPPVGEAEREALEEIVRALGYPSREWSVEILAPRLPPATADREDEETFPVAALNSVLAADHGELRRELFALLAARQYERGDLERAEYREQVLEWCRVLARGGYGALSFPDYAGGRGDLGAFVVAFQTLAFSDLSLVVKFGVQFGLWGGSILNLGTEEQRRRWLPEIATLDLPGCFAMTETGHGSNVREIETTATFDPDRDELVLHTPSRAARKDYIGNAARHGRMATVFAQLLVDGQERGVHAVVAPIRNDHGEPVPGVELEDCGRKIGLEGVDNGRIRFDRLRVPRSNLLGRFAEIDDQGRYSSPIASSGKRFFTMLGTLVGGRIAVAAASVSAAQKGLAIAVRYGLERRQFGPPGEPETRLLDYPTHQRRLMPRLAKTCALHFAVDELRRSFVDRPEDSDSQPIELLAAGLKAACSWNAIDVLQSCRECCGGAGYLSVNQIGDLRADTDVFATFEGDNVVLLQLVAKGLLSDYRHQFGDLRLGGVLRLLARRAGRELSERNPIQTRRTATEHLRDPDFQHSALAYRADRLLSTVAGRLRARIKSGMSSDQALMECQTHLVVAARAHVDRVIGDAVLATIEAAGAESPVIEVLGLVRDLWALSCLEENAAWYLRHDYFEPQKVSAIRQEVDHLCLAFRGHARSLVDAFGIPDELITAPIAGAG